jgi:hypothetical protein
MNNSTRFPEFRQKRSNRPADTRMECDLCGQRHMRRAEMIVAAGTRHSSSVGPKYTVNHTSQTELASRYAVPTSGLHEKFWVWSFSLIGYFVGTAAYNFFSYEDLAWYTCYLGIGGGAALIYYAIVRWVFPGFYSRLVSDRKVIERKSLDFAYTWVCMDCGHAQVRR